jgi:hypothetical protein
MNDSDGPQVTDSFYEELFKTCHTDAPLPQIPPDLTRAAYALHCAVLKLRADGVPVMRWVPFVHYGL